MTPKKCFVFRSRLALAGLVVTLIFTGGFSFASAQTVFNALVPGPNGPVHGLFQVQNGNVSAIATGLSTNQFPALSRDGRFITISAPDPAQPNQVATDLFTFDRVTGTRGRTVNYTAEQQQDGSFVTPHAAFSALSPNNQLVALQTLLLVTTSQPPSSNSVPMLTVNRASDGFQLSLAEMGQGNAIDFFRAEFVGISWSPNGSVFATPAYVNTTTQLGQPGATVGIVLFGFNAGTGQWQRTGQVTQPRIFDNVFPTAIETHIMPAISPDGQRIAYFEITWPDALLQNPASARLLVVNSNGGAPQTLVNFNPGFFPLGLTWSADGANVIYSIAPQTQAPGGGFAPSGEPQGAVIRFVNSINPTSIGLLPGIDTGFFPTNPLIGGPGVDLRETSLSFLLQPDGSFLLSAPGLNPNATYRLESSTDLSVFGSSQNFSGQQVMNGIRIETPERKKFFRLSTLP